jgi:hypothetical protein
MTRHASTDQLASLAVGELRRRKAARITAHVAGCARCTHVSQELAEVPALLAAAPYPPLPHTVDVRIEAALRIEVSQRLSLSPASEAGRRDLPVRSRRERAWTARGGWHLPGLSVPASRLVGAAGALALIGGGGYLLASNLPAGVGTSSSSSASVPSQAQPMTQGPDVTYGSPGSQRTVDSVSSSTNFQPSQLRSQALGAYHEAQVKGEVGTSSSGGASAPTAMTPLNNSAAGAAGTGSRLAGCMDAIGAGRTVLLIDNARYEGKPATITIIAGTATSQAEVVVTASTCSASSPDVLARAPLGHL